MAKTRRQNKSRRNSRTRKHHKGGDEVTPAASTKGPYILVQVFPDNQAQYYFKKNVTDNSLKNNYYFRIENIKTTSNLPLKKRFFSGKYDSVLGDISKIKFTGTITPSSYIAVPNEMEKDPSYNKEIKIEFKLSKNLKKIIPLASVSGEYRNTKYNLSSGMFGSKKELIYIPRAGDMFQGDIRKNMLQKFPYTPESINND